MRNIFDQYDQPENRLTHALVSTLQQDEVLLHQFLQWLKIPRIPGKKSLRITEQEIPGRPEFAKVGKDGLPDAFFYTSDGEWAVVVEAKVQAKLTGDQIKRHLATAERYGFVSPRAVTITVNKPTCVLPPKTISKTWQEIYQWLSRQCESPWAMTLVNYMQVFEAKMLSKKYKIEGTITMFDGFKFTDEYPYTYSEGKRLIQVLGKELRKHPVMRKQVKIDHKSKGRTKITQGRNGAVWDFLQLRAGAKADGKYPHAAIAVHPELVEAYLTIPNSVVRAFRKRLKEKGLDAFRKLVVDIEKRARPIVEQSSTAQPRIWLAQRHYKSQSSTPTNDAGMYADLRCVNPDIKKVETETGTLHYQPGWLESIFEVLSQKRSNLQLAVGVWFKTDCKTMQEASAVDLIADACNAATPILSLLD